MVEAIHSLTQTQRLAQRQLQAVRVLCERRAQEEIKDQIRREGRVKLRSVPRREHRKAGQGEGDGGCSLSRKANRRGKADRRALALGATWRAAHNLGNTSVAEVAGNQPLLRNATQAHNGAGK